MRIECTFGDAVERRFVRYDFDTGEAEDFWVPATICSKSDENWASVAVAYADGTRERVQLKEVRKPRPTGGQHE